MEDEPDHVWFVERALRSRRIDNPLRVVDRGDLALAYLAGEGPYADRAAYPLPGLILLDLKLPRVSGFEILDWLRGRPDLRRVPVAILTSSKHPRDLKRALELGAATYMVKPADAAELAALVDAVRLCLPSLAV